MKTKVTLTIALSILLTTAIFAQESQKRFGIEFNGDVSIVASDLSGSSLNTGLGFETILLYQFMPYTSVYGGWGWNHFNSNESFAGSDIDFEQTGYILGLQFKQDIATSPIAWFIRAGALLCHIETENNDGEIISDSGHGFGWQAAGGIEVALGKNWSLTPGLKYNFLSRETEFGDVNYQLDHRYVSARLGIVKKF
jgi:opacity protein-like surface antigen